MGKNTRILVRKTLSSIIATLFVAAVIFLLPIWFYVGVVILVIGVCQYEFFSLYRNKRGVPLPWAGVLLGIFIPIGIILTQAGGNPDIVEFGWVFLILVSLCFPMFAGRKSEVTFFHTLIMIFGWLYISWLFSFFIKLKYLPGGSLLVGFLILSTKSGDIAAYLIGKSFGKKRLIPRISPNKTYVGALAGLATSVSAAILARDMIGAPLWQAPLLGGVLSILAQFGDLVESLIKRERGIKDTGKLVPGFGGLLDMIDSVFFAAAVFYFYCRYIL